MTERRQIAPVKLQAFDNFKFAGGARAVFD